MVLTSTTTPQVPADIATEILRLKQELEGELGVINEKASAKQEAVLRYQRWLKEEQSADLEVCRIHFLRRIEQLVVDDLGQTFTPGPIRGLPIELLSYIFKYYVDSDESPWKLAKVSKYWKETAMRTPYLWRYICVSLQGTYGEERFVVDGEFRFSKKSMQICCNKSKLLGALRRSGAVPLVVNFHWDSPMNKLLALTNILLTSPVCERIATLRFGSSYMPEEMILPYMSIGRFPSLMELHFTSEIKLWCHELIKSVSSSSTKLEKAGFSSGLSPALCTLSFWSRLKELLIYEKSCLNQVSANLVNLERFPSRVHDWPDDATPASTWENVRSIDIICCFGYLGRLHLPNVESLVYTEVGRQESGTSLQFLYPKLIKLDVTISDILWLSKISAPLVTHLALTSMSGEPFPSLLPGDIFPEVEVLTLKINCEDPSTISLIQCFPKIHSLSLLGGRKEMNFGLDICRRLDASNQPLLCPHLASVSLGKCESPVYTLKKNALPLIKKAITSRKKIHQPLVRFSVCWSKDRFRTEEYV